MPAFSRATASATNRNLRRSSTVTDRILPVAVWRPPWTSNRCQRLHHHVATQRMRQRLADAHVDQLPHQPRRLRTAIEVDDAVAFGATHQFGCAGGAETSTVALDQDALHRAHAAGADALHVLLDQRLQLLQTLELQVLRRLVGPGGRRPAPAGAEQKP